LALRISFDLDGTLADFTAAFRSVETRLFGDDASTRTADSGEINDEIGEEQRRQERAQRRSPGRRDAIWREIEATPDFWTTLDPLDPHAVGRIHELTLRHHWEVFFITQRPATAGDTVQRQTQRWLANLGYDYPSVIVLEGSRGRAIRALDIDYHVDDSTQNCLDVVADSTARTILIATNPSDGAVGGARKMGIAVAAGIGEALDILEQAALARTNPTMLQRLSALVGWKLS
jgi:beta-phosphoglucomutase-like phosphatase (HAD superfamily)